MFLFAKVCDVFRLLELVSMLVQVVAVLEHTHCKVTCSPEIEGLVPQDSKGKVGSRRQMCAEMHIFTALLLRPYEDRLLGA